MAGDGLSVIITGSASGLGAASAAMLAGSGLVVVHIAASNAVGATGAVAVAETTTSGSSTLTAFLPGGSVLASLGVSPRSAWAAIEQFP